MRSVRCLDPEVIVRLYYTHPNGLGTKELQELFDVSSDSMVSRIRQQIRQVQAATNRTVWNPRMVNTDAAFEYAGIDIREQERLLAKRQELGIASACAENV